MYLIQLKKTVFNLAKGNILFLPYGIINKNMPKILGQTLTYHLLRHSLTTKAHKNYIISEINTTGRLAYCSSGKRTHD